MTTTIVHQSYKLWSLDFKYVYEPDAFLATHLFVNRILYI